MIVITVFLIAGMALWVVSLFTWLHLAGPLFSELGTQMGFRRVLVWASGLYLVIGFVGIFAAILVWGSPS